MLSCIFSIVTAAEIDNHPPVDHNAIFQKANQSVPDIKSMRQAEVLSVIDTNGYTYIEVNQNNETVWLAVPAAAVKAGDTIHYPDGPIVLNHISRSLDRTFPSVIFLMSIVVNSDK